MKLHEDDFAEIAWEILRTTRWAVIKNFYRLFNKDPYDGPL